MPLILFLLPLLFLACGELETNYSDDEKELNYNYRMLKAYFYHPEKIKEYKTYQGMEVDSMYESLKDYFCGRGNINNCSSRYTYYLPPEKSDDKIKEIENTYRYYSFGFERSWINSDLKDTLYVSAVYPISPAADAGLKKYDKLLFADNVSLIGDSAALYFKTDSLFATTTVFTVLRGGEIIPLPAMQKKEVPEPTVYLDSLEGIPLITITEFTRNTNNPEGTYAEFKKILQTIKGTKTAIIDIRYNPGGNIPHCTAIAAELAPSLNNELVYDVEHKYDKKRGNVIDTTHHFVKDYLKSIGDGADINWIIIQSGRSASCAERFAAAVKYNRPETVIIGQPSYGKGIGQTYGKTYLGGLAYITCMQSYYPDGTTFHEVGVGIDVPAESIDELRYAAIEAAHNFGSGVLAKQSAKPVLRETLLPEHLPRKTDLGAYKAVDLFHQWE